MVAEIHLAKIYFADASDFKVRPVLLLKLNSFRIYYICRLQVMLTLRE